MINQSFYSKVLKYKKREVGLYFLLNILFVLLSSSVKGSIDFNLLNLLFGFVFAIIWPFLVNDTSFSKRLIKSLDNQSNINRVKITKSYFEYNKTRSFLIPTNSSLIELDKLSEIPSKYPIVDILNKPNFDIMNDIEFIDKLKITSNRILYDLGFWLIALILCVFALFDVMQIPIIIFLISFILFSYLNPCRLMVLEISYNHDEELNGLLKSSNLYNIPEILIITYLYKYFSKIGQKY